jgi:hypothetical protein
MLFKTVLDYPPTINFPKESDLYKSKFYSIVETFKDSGIF